MIKAKKIKMKWSKSDDPTFFNFGDDIGPYIVKKLSGLEIEYIRFAKNRFIITLQFINKLLHGNFTLNNLSSFLKSFFAKEYLLTTGSILQWYSSSRAVVWGSGIIDMESKINPAKKYFAVRGKYSKEKIESFNCNKSIVLGDPAILLPIIYSPKIKKKYKLGIIPHYIHFQQIVKTKLPADTIIINLNSPNIEKIIDDIYSCQYTISTSLHGLIVSHSYGKHSLWYKVENSPLSGDNIKFLDYFSSVNIPEYKPFIFNFENKLNTQQIIDNLNKNKSISYPKRELSEIQKELIGCAPFPVKKEYLNYLDHLPKLI